MAWLPFQKLSCLKRGGGLDCWMAFLSNSLSKQIQWPEKPLSHYTFQRVNLHVNMDLFLKTKNRAKRTPVACCFYWACLKKSHYEPTATEPRSSVIPARGVTTNYSQNSRPARKIITSNYCKHPCRLVIKFIIYINGHNSSGEILILIKMIAEKAEILRWSGGFLPVRCPVR